MNFAVESEGNMDKSSKIFYVVCVVMILWLIASYVNTISHNMSDCDYAAWNAFDILCNMREGA